MQRGKEPVSASRLVGLAVAVGLGVAAAIAGLIASQPGDDAQRAGYLVALLAGGATVTLLASLASARRVEIARLRVNAAALVFELRARPTVLADVENGNPDELGEELRETTRLAARARRMIEVLVVSGAEQEAIELRVAIEAIEVALRPRDVGEDENR